MKKSFFATLFMFIALSFSAFAMDLQQAKQAGLVGEQLNGYLGVVKPKAEVTALVNEVNGKRKAAYQQLAKKHQITTEEVARLAAQKAQQLTAKGEYIESAPGQWIKK